jgi:hypothetical protein
LVGRADGMPPRDAGLLAIVGLILVKEVAYRCP